MPKVPTGSAVKHYKMSFIDTAFSVWHIKHARWASQS